MTEIAGWRDVPSNNESARKYLDCLRFRSEVDVNYMNSESNIRLQHLATTWHGIIDDPSFASKAGMPKSVEVQVRIYQRYFSISPQ